MSALVDGPSGLVNVTIPAHTVIPLIKEESLQEQPQLVDFAKERSLPSAKIPQPGSFVRQLQQTRHAGTAGPSVVTQDLHQEERATSRRSAITRTVVRVRLPGVRTLAAIRPLRVIGLTPRPIHRRDSLRAAGP